MKPEAVNALCEFGRRAEAGEQSAIAEGGFVIPGGEPVSNHMPGEEDFHERRSEGTEGRDFGQAREGQGPQAEASASDQASHPIRKLRFVGVPEWELEGLSDLYTDIRVVDHPSSRFALLSMTLGLLADADDRARLYLEIPVAPWDRLTRIAANHPAISIPMPPAIRGWAVWQGGAAHGFPIRSHHENPDGSICACMSYQWIRGVHCILDYVAFCTSWVVKALHERELHRYPGPQHLPPWIRLRRLRLDELCGCGKHEIYRYCCWQRDRGLSRTALLEAARESREKYFSDLQAQYRSVSPLGDSFGAWT